MNRKPKIGSSLFRERRFDLPRISAALSVASGSGGLVSTMLLLGLLVPVPPAQAQRSSNSDLANGAKTAAEAIAKHQHAAGYWTTSYTSQPRFEHPKIEVNTFLTSVMIDILKPQAAAAGLDESLRRAQHHLSGHIEDGGLVRYHGRPQSPWIGAQGCRITPDTDDTSLVWRIAPSSKKYLLQQALATIREYRTSEGLYRTWLAPKEKYECLDPGKDPNPPDVAIQMHLLLLLTDADAAAGRALCAALQRAISDDRIWVYYHATPLIPIFRKEDLRRAGCPVQLPAARLHAEPGQEVWVSIVQALDSIRSDHRGRQAPASTEVMALLRKLSTDDFSALRENPPLLYHNDLSASVPRFYWSEDAGYALWLRLYFENAARH